MLIIQILLLCLSNTEPTKKKCSVNKSPLDLSDERIDYKKLKELNMSDLASLVASTKMLAERKADQMILTYSGNVYSISIDSDDLILKKILISFGNSIRHYDRRKTEIQDREKAKIERKLLQH